MDCGDVHLGDSLGISETWWRQEAIHYTTHYAEVENVTGKTTQSKGGVTVSAMPSDPTVNP